jgi:endonuclease/exonuclease/phosphatase family metal-dependent hydrolase
MPGMAAASPPRFTVATYNIHKGFSQLARRMVIHELRERLRGLAADILFLQEVLHTHERHATRYREWPARPQHEFIADAGWNEIAYGRNAVYPHGHHGNAILSRFPMLAQENLDISAHLFESRGLLHCEVALGEHQPSLHCINVHLGLFERGRQWQIQALIDRIQLAVPRGAPLIIAGDFNDWRGKGGRTLTEALDLVEVFGAVRGRPARTFPSMLPVFRLDRIYARGLRIVDVHVHYTTRGVRMSDHAALAATFEIAARRRRHDAARGVSRL